MYLDCKVPVPGPDAKIARKKINGTTYIYHETSRPYSKEKKYTDPKRKCIGKLVPGNDSLMVPNEAFLKFFPNAILPEEKEGCRSSCIRIGAYLVIRRIISEYKLDVMLARIIGEDAGLFLDLAAYSIITENNAAQYYPEYAWNHPLLTREMVIFSDSKISSFLHDTSIDQRVQFLNEWNEKRDHREKIYISYDSTNKTSQAGDLELAEIGHPKVDVGKEVFNYAMAYDCTNREPLFYESYLGSIVDISQLQYMLEKAKGYGYRHVGFILGRGYFSKGNIQFMDSHGFEFILMVKGMKSLVKDLIHEVRGTFEDSRQYSIRSYKVSGITVKHRLYPSDEKERYFHIYYSDSRKSAEREELETRIDHLARKLKECMGMEIRLGKEFQKYFELVYWHEGMDDEKFMFGRERNKVIDEEIRLCGYFVIITSEKMTAENALTLYKSRDASEKLFRGDKSYLGARCERVHSNESVDTKIFIEFVAMIIRCRMYVLLKDEMIRSEKKLNYMTVPAAIRELEKIEMIKGADNAYRLDYAVTATQKAILKAFGMTAANVTEQARVISSELERIETEALEKATAQLKEKDG